MKRPLKSVVFVACAVNTLGLMCGGLSFYCLCGSPAITVRVVDEATGEAVTDATVTASDGVATETLSLRRYSNDGGPCAVPFADYSGIAAPGSYVVRVEADGYETVVIENVYVPQDNSEGNYCGYTPVDWFVRLNAAP